jgi:hypothetical protein
MFKGPWTWKRIIVLGLPIAITISLIARGPKQEVAKDNVAAAAASTVAPGEKPGVVDRHLEMHEGRKRSIQKMIDEGFISEITMTSQSSAASPRVWVTRRFQAVDFKSKQVLMSVIFAFYFDGRERLSDRVLLVDNMTGKDIGRFTLDGLELY